MIQPADDDPIIAEIRRIREEWLAKFGYDMNLLMEDLTRRAQRFPHRRVSFKVERRRPTEEPTT
ncbi:MAG: hypothetical protein QOI59_2182 [Gammaproteobacteria bacterium]|jgi:hypothetical protein|nr:hypothetical protein [Gammaproteobacteria bacterium]